VAQGGEKKESLAYRIDVEVPASNSFRLKAVLQTSLLIEPLPKIIAQ